MTRRTTRASVAGLGAAMLMVASLGAGTFAQSPSAVAPVGTPYPDPIEQPPAPTADIKSYPNYGGGVDCENGTFNGRPYGGNLKSIDARDAQTVVFTFCNPNVAFLAQVAFSALAIDDAQYLIDHAPDGSIVTQPNGTGPYKFVSWDLGSRIDLAANDAYWGTKALTPNMEFQWNPDSAARYLALSGGTVDGIDNPGKDDMPNIEGNADLKLYPREGLNTLFIGMNNTYKPWNNQKVRQAIAMGINRQRVVDNFLPPGSEVAKFFTPCAIPFGCAGDDWYTFDAAAAKALLAEGLQEEGIDPATFTTKLSFRPPPRPYLPDPPTVATEIATQLQENLGITIDLDQQESTTYIDNSNAGTLDGLFLLGWGADFPDADNFMNYHFGTGAGAKFGPIPPDLVDAVKRGAQSAADADREAAYTEANNLVKQYVPLVFVSHAGSGTAFKADIEGAHSSPLQNEAMAVMKAGDRDILTFMQNGEPGGLYCGDETDGEALRVCEQIKESLYAYKVGGTDTQPSLATSCEPNDELTVWTCTLRDGVTFHDGSTLDSSDVVLSYAAQWDTQSPLHVGRTGGFDYWISLVGQGFLNPAGPCGLSNTAPCP